ncbi:MAG: hypothetical protein JW778_00025 [Candidatus Altiarchaeota archaeon]|nr:hypothetical protein [Candidatus Altiarchaeota archaeon]
MKRLIVVFILVLLCGCVQRKEASFIRPQSPERKITDLIEPYPKTLSSSTCPTTTTSTTLPFPPVSDVLQSGWASSAPEIDGTVSSSEWSGASMIVLSGFDRLYVMNNDSHVFFLYMVLDGNRFYGDSALFIDPTNDGRYNRIYGDRHMFIVLPLFEGVVGDGGGIYCGNSIFGVDGKFCGEYLERVISDGGVSYSKSPSYIISEVSLPIDSKDGVFFWLLYGYPSATCFPESMQCHSQPFFAKLVLADESHEGEVLLYGDSVGPLDYYDIRPTP